LCVCVVFGSFLPVQIWVVQYWSFFEYGILGNFAYL